MSGVKEWFASWLLISWRSALVLAVVLYTLIGFLVVPWIAERVIELDEKHYFGSAHLFLMVYYGSVGKVMGGSPEKAKEEYEKAWEIGKGKYLLPKYLFAKTYCLQTLDRELFEKLLGEIIHAPDDLLPEQALTNAIIKVKARRLLNMADDLF